MTSREVLLSIRRNWLSGIVVGLLIAPIIAGPILAVVFDNGDWLWLCIFIVFFLS